LVAALAVCGGAAAIGGVVTNAQLEDWYASLRRPGFAPPNYVFGPVWSVLYLTMAVAAWLVWRRDVLSASILPLGLFLLQLVANVAWSCLFFGLQSPALALVEIFLLWGLIAATLIAFWRRSRLAGLLLVPYLAWVTFAAVLNFAFWRLNG
jgi:tryptophan-rich sensory protein